MVDSGPSSGAKSLAALLKVHGYMGTYLPVHYCSSMYVREEPHPAMDASTLLLNLPHAATVAQERGLPRLPDSQ